MLALRTGLQTPGVQLSTDNIALLLSEWHDLKNYDVRSWYLLQIQGAINSNIIDKNVLLSGIIGSTRDWVDLILIGWLLRLGANPNMYVESPLGPSHIAVYTIIQGTNNKLDRDIIIAICIMLTIQGEKLNLKIVENPSYKIQVLKKKGIKTQFTTKVNNIYPKNEKVVVPTKTLSVGEWMGENNFPNPNLYLEIFNHMNTKIPSVIGTALSIPDIAYLDPNVVPSFELVVTCRATELLQKYPFDDGGKHYQTKSGEINGYIDCIMSGYLDGFFYILNTGIGPNYFTINRLCIEISKSIDNNDPLFTDNLVEMLVRTIDYGYLIDVNQINILRAADTNLAAEIEKRYSQPAWKKACTYPNNEFQKSSIQKLAFTLGLNTDDSPVALCQQFETFSMGDIETLRTSAIQRQKQQIWNSVHPLSSSAISAQGCTNSGGRAIVPEEYSDANIIYYRDGNNIFCYTSEMFEDLLVTKVDPSTKKKLSPSVLRDIQQQLDLILSYDLDPAHPESVADGLRQLHGEDVIGSEETENVVKNAQEVLREQGIPIYTVGQVDATELNRILLSINMQQEFLPLLSPSHQLDTFYVAIYYALDKNPELIKILVKYRKPRVEKEIIPSKIQHGPQRPIYLIEEVNLTSGSKIETSAPAQTNLFTEKQREIALQHQKLIEEQMESNRQITLYQTVNPPVQINNTPISAGPTFVPSNVNFLPPNLVTTVPPSAVNTGVPIQYNTIPVYPNTGVPQSSGPRAGIALQPVKLQFGTSTQSQQVQQIPVQQVQQIPVQQVRNVPVQQVQQIPVQQVRNVPVQQVLIQPAVPRVQVGQEQQAAVIAEQQAILRQQQQTIAFQQQELQNKQSLASRQALARQAEIDAQRQQQAIAAQQQAAIQQQVFIAQQREQGILSQQQNVINQQNQALNNQRAIIAQQQQQLGQPVQVSIRETNPPTIVRPVPVQQFQTVPTQALVATDQTTLTNVNYTEYLPTQTQRYNYTATVGSLGSPY